MSTSTNIDNDRKNEIKWVLESIREIMLEEERKKPLSSKYTISSTVKLTLGGVGIGGTIEGTLILNNMLETIQKNQLLGVQQFSINIWDSIEETIKAIQSTIKKVVDEIVVKAKKVAEDIKKEIIEKMSVLYSNFLHFVAEYPNLNNGGMSGFFEVPKVLKVELALKFEKK